MSTGADAYRPIEPVGAGFEGRNKRKYPRYALTLPGRFMRADKLDHPCRLINISAESAAMTTPVPLVVGEKLIVYLMHLGGLEGSVVRLFPDCFAMMISATQRKRDKLAVQIPRLAAQSEIPEGEEREFPRVARRAGGAAGAARRQHHGLPVAGSVDVGRLGPDAGAPRPRL